MYVVHANKRGVYKNLEISVPWCGSLYVSAGIMCLYVGFLMSSKNKFRRESYSWYKSFAKLRVL